jgi:hypothetical protein
MEQGQLKSDAGLSALLDFGFKRFITLSIIKIVYMVGMGLIVLCWLGFLAVSFTQGAAAAIGVLIVGPIVAGLYLIFLRISLELVVVIFRIGENTSKLVEQRGGQAGPAAGV